MIYNVSKRVGEDIVAHAAHFSSIARTARPLQENEIRCLEFLVRDWEYFDFPEGLNQEERSRLVSSNAEEYLKKDVMGRKEVEEMNETRNALSASFTSISLALLPHPGKAVTKPDFFDHQTDKMDETFRQMFLSYCDSVLDRLVRMIECSEDEFFFGREIYLVLSEACEHFRDRTPRLESLFSSASRASNMFAAERARKAFDEAFVNTPENFGVALRSSIETFDHLARFGPDEMKDEFRQTVADYAQERMEKETKIKMQIKLKRRRIKQAIVATSAGVVLAPFWIPTVISAALRSVAFFSASATSVVVGESAAPLVLTGMSSFAAILVASRIFKWRRGN